MLQIAQWDFSNRAKHQVIAVLSCTIAVGPFVKSQYKLKQVLVEVLVTRGKLLCPVKNQIQGLNVYM